MRKILNFQLFVADYELLDLGYNGFKYTWCNNREDEDIIRERLDYVLNNVSLREDFPQLQVLTLTPQVLTIISY